MRSFWRVGAGVAAGALALGAASPPHLASLTPDEVPRLKAGLWRGQVSVDGGAPVIGNYCNHGDPVVKPPKGRCSHFEVRRAADGSIVTDSSCVDDSGVSASLHSVTSGDYATAYVQDGRTERTMALQPPLVTTAHMSFRYIGPCSKKGS
ncbi:MAG TPA: DUF3617 family protein [Caulobacteraceae bacterium]|nr:DUF3617 family protein [Caulobacteraceae bacterium]